MADSLDAIVKLVGLFGGSGKTTQTQSSKVSADGLDAILKSALEGNQGLASVLQGQNSAGLYNSSTNRLLANDLVSRLTAQAAANSKTVTTTQQTASPLSSMGEKTQLGAGAVLLKGLLGSGSKVIGSDKAQGQLGGLASDVKGAYNSIKDWISPSLTTDGANSVTSVAQDLNLANAVSNPSLGLDLSGTGEGISGNIDVGSFLKSAQGLGEQSDAFAAFADSLLGNSDTASAASTVDTATQVVGDSSSNFPSAASESLSRTGGIVSDAANSSTSGGVYVDSSGNLAGSEGADFSSAYSDSAGNSTVTAADLGGTASTDILGGSGSNLGYVGSLVAALNAPEAQYGKDYRQAVGSAVLNYFGWGWASPIVDAVARPALDASMEAGNESLGDFGTVLADPIGAPLSGQYDQEGLVTSTLDPGNLLGGNEGGSVGSLMAAGLDPIGAALGDTGVFSEAKDAFNSVASAVNDVFGLESGGGGGKVICTELAYQDRLDIGLYKLSIDPRFTLTGRTLRGYHVIGVPFVRLLRKSDWWAEKVTPWVAAYIKHKAGEKNWRGRVVKSILHPISWVLGFFNNNPEYFRVLYRRERKV